MVKYNVKKIVFPSTAAIYGSPNYLPIDEKHPTLPVSIYGASKLFDEKYIEMYYEAYGIRYSILRYANVYGPLSRSVISLFIDKIKNKENPAIFGDGNQTRDYIYVDDVVEATLAAMKIKGNVKLNISTGKETSTNDVLSSINKHMKTNLGAIYKPEKKGETRNISLSNELANKTLNWKPTTEINDGIKKMVG